MLVECEACKATVSEAAKTCIHCGHPLKSRNNIALIATGAALTALLALVFWKLQLHEGSPMASGAANEPSREVVSTESEGIEFPTAKETHRAMMLRAVRDNAELPKMVSPFIRQVRTAYDASSSTMTFTYQVMNERLFNETVQPSINEAIETTYCESHVMSDLRANGVNAQWIYLAGGRELFNKTVGGC